MMQEGTVARLLIYMQSLNAHFPYYATEADVSIHSAAEAAIVLPCFTIAKEVLLRMWNKVDSIWATVLHRHN